MFFNIFQFSIFQCPPSIPSHPSPSSSSHTTSPILRRLKPIQTSKPTSRGIHRSARNRISISSHYHQQPAKPTSIKKEVLYVHRSTTSRITILGSYTSYPLGWDLLLHREGLEGKVKKEKGRRTPVGAQAQLTPPKVEYTSLPS